MEFVFIYHCFALISAVLLYLATEISGFQNFAFNSADNFSKEQQRAIIREATENSYRKWTSIFILLLVLIILGIASMTIDCSKIVEYFNCAH